MRRLAQMVYRGQIRLRTALRWVWHWCTSPVPKKSVSPAQPFCAAHVFSCHLSCAGSCRTASAFLSRRCLPQHQQEHMPQKRSAAAGCNMDSLDHRRLRPAIPRRRDKPTNHTCRFVPVCWRRRVDRGRLLRHSQAATI